MMVPDCLFCRIVQKEVPADIVCEDEYLLAFKDIDPKAPVHLLIIPKKHYPTLPDCDDPHLLGHLMTTAGDLSRKFNINNSGFRIVLNCNEDGGQAVYHIHLHLLGGRTLQWPPG